MLPSSVHQPSSQECARTGDAWLSALTYWYLTGIIAAMGFSFGYHFVRPAGATVAEERNWLDAFAWMDGRWYKEIAEQGYEYDPGKGTNVAFFPLYPLLCRAVMTISGWRAEVALLVVANISFLAALAMLAIYVRDRYCDAPAELAHYTMLTAALFPTSCFFRLVYSESTFLFVTVLAMYMILRGGPLWAIALTVGLATATRSVGVALLLPFAINIVRRSYATEAPVRQTSMETGDSSLSAGRQMRTAASSSPSLRRWFTPSTARHLALYLPLGCWGLVAFTAYQYINFGEPFATVKVQKYWGIQATWREKLFPLMTLQPLFSVYDARSDEFWIQRDQHGIPWFSLQFANPIFFSAAIALIAIGACLSVRERLRDGGTSPRRDGRLTRARWLSLEEVSLSALLLLIPYVTRAYEMRMGSMGRFVAVVFPIYLVLGHVLLRLPGPLRAALLALSGLFVAIYTALYAARYDIF